MASATRSTVSTETPAVSAASRTEGNESTVASKPVVASATNSRSTASSATVCANTARANARSVPGRPARAGRRRRRSRFSTGTTTISSLSSSLALSAIHRYITGCATAGFAPQITWVSASGILVGRRRRVAPERLVVGGDGRGHTEGGVGVVVPGAEAAPRELPQRVRRLVRLLAASQHRDAVPRFGQRVLDMRDDRPDRRLPARGDEGAVLLTRGRVSQSPSGSAVSLTPRWQARPRLTGWDASPRTVSSP